jgi:hypothetical protein
MITKKIEERRKQRNKKGGDINFEDLTGLKRNITTKLNVISCSLVDMYNPEYRSGARGNAVG